MVQSRNAVWCLGQAEQCPLHVPTDVKFDAVSGDYYPIIYFNDYPINESLASLPLRVSFCPLSLWRWQLYAAQSTKSPWNFLGDELYEQSDEEQDSVKVCGAPQARGSGESYPRLPRLFHDCLAALPPNPSSPWGPGSRLDSFTFSCFLLARDTLSNGHWSSSREVLLGIPRNM